MILDYANLMRDIFTFSTFIIPSFEFYSSETAGTIFFNAVTNHEKHRLVRRPTITTPTDPLKGFAYVTANQLCDVSFISQDSNFEVLALCTERCTHA